MIHDAIRNSLSFVPRADRRIPPEGVGISDVDVLGSVARPVALPRDGDASSYVLADMALAVVEKGCEKSKPGSKKFGLF